MAVEQFWNEALESGKFGIFIDAKMHLIPRSDVPSFLSWVSGKAIVLGVEGFKYEDGVLEPLMDCIIDYSNGDPSKSIDSIKSIIDSDSAWNNVDFLEFVLK